MLRLFVVFSYSAYTHIHREYSIFYLLFCSFDRSICVFIYICLLLLMFLSSHACMCVFFACLLLLFCLYISFRDSVRFVGSDLLCVRFLTQNTRTHTHTLMKRQVARNTLSYMQSTRRAILSNAQRSHKHTLTH